MRRRGLRQVIQRVLRGVARKSLADERKVTCRLYGGWFRNDSLSPDASSLSTELRAQFPRPMKLGDHTSPQSVLVSVELARSLWIDTAIDLTHTYRQRSLPRGLRCKRTPYTGCRSLQNCPIADLNTFMWNASCPEPRCMVAPSSVLYRGEQKLVDSMIVIDLASLALQTSRRLIVVSADEDLWPGIRFALLCGSSVTHILPRQGWSGSNRYRRLQTDEYSCEVM